MSYYGYGRKSVPKPTISRATSSVPSLKFAKRGFELEIPALPWKNYKVLNNNPMKSAVATKPFI